MHIDTMVLQESKHVTLWMIRPIAQLTSGLFFFIVKHFCAILDWTLFCIFTAEEPNSFPLTRTSCSLVFVLNLSTSITIILVLMIKKWNKIFSKKSGHAPNYLRFSDVQFPHSLEHQNCLYGIIKYSKTRTILNRKQNRKQTSSKWNTSFSVE